MIEEIKYCRQLRKLNRKCDKTSRFYAKKEAEAKSSDDRESLRAEAGSEIVPIMEEIDSLQTKRFRRLANKLLVPMPEHSNKEMWSQRYYGYGYILTDKGFWEINKRIRQERRERSERFIVWIPALVGILAAIAGIIAAITGLAAVMIR